LESGRGKERGGGEIGAGVPPDVPAFLWDQRAEKKVREPEDKSLFRQAEVLSKK